MSTGVTLVKFGCNAAACNSEKEISRITAQIGTEQNRVKYPSGEHASTKFGVTGYSYVAAEKPSPPAPPPGVLPGSSNTSLIVLVAALCVLVLVSAGAAFYFYQQAPSEVNGYVPRNSFPVPDHLVPQKPQQAPGTTGPQGDDGRASLLNSAV